MRTRLSSAAVAVALLAAACTPSLDWRELDIGSTGLKATMPCKPDKATRDVPMAARTVPLEAFGCEAAGATFAVLHADIRDAAQAGPVLAQWRVATLANLHAPGAKDTAFVPQGADAIAQSMQVVAEGRRADGSAVQSQAVYFAHGAEVFQAVIYASRIEPAMTEFFFTGLKFQP